MYFIGCHVERDKRSKRILTPGRPAYLSISRPPPPTTDLTLHSRPVRLFQHHHHHQLVRISSRWRIAPIQNNNENSRRMVNIIPYREEAVGAFMWASTTMPRPRTLQTPSATSPNTARILEGQITCCWKAVIKIFDHYLLGTTNNEERYAVPGMSHVGRQNIEEMVGYICMQTQITPRVWTKGAQCQAESVVILRGVDIIVLVLSKSSAARNGFVAYYEYYYYTELK